MTFEKYTAPLKRERVKDSMTLGEREWKNIWHGEREWKTVWHFGGWERESVKDSVTLREWEWKTMQYPGRIIVVLGPNIVFSVKSFQFCKTK